MDTRVKPAYDDVPCVPEASYRPVSAVHHHDRPRDISRKIRREEDRGADDILRLAGAAERGVGDEGFGQLRIGGAYLFVQWRFDKAGADRIDADAFLAEFGGQRPGEAEHAVFRGGIGRRTRRLQI